eukprot:4829809-Pyramimonas_sp.AAC.1
MQPIQRRAVVRESCSRSRLGAGHPRHCCRPISTLLSSPPSSPRRGPTTYAVTPVLRPNPGPPEIRGNQ